MKHLALTCLLALSACTLPPIQPATVANATTLDERTGIAATTGYTAASVLGNRLSRAGIIDRARFKALDNQGYAAVLAIRAAYDAGNATGYAEAITKANAAVDAIKGLVQ